MTENQKKVIILNKPFIGDWLNDDTNIGHEIIDFIKADDGKYYVYNTPYGSCPDNIKCLDDNDMDNTKYTAEYMILTGQSQKDGKTGSSFDVLYVIKLKKKLHSEHLKRQERVRMDLNIKYDGKTLEEIYPNNGKDTSLLATFEASEIYEAINPIRVKLANYNFQRNKGYIDSDKSDYKTFDIVKWRNDGLLIELELKTLQKTTINNQKTFLDLIHLENNEQVFTNIMHGILSYDNVLQLFVNKFTENNKYNLGKVNVEREKVIDSGRCDIYAKCDNCIVIIENKIFSGLNGIRDDITQLSTYYNEAKQTNLQVLCFITVPDTRKQALIKEINDKDPNMSGVYSIVTYSEIADFIKNYAKELQNWSYSGLLADIEEAFRNLSKLTKLDVYAQKFYTKVQSIKVTK